MITVVGGGPAGLLTAKEAARFGTKVRVYEEHPEIGKPVQCTGLVSRSGLDALEVDYFDSVLNDIRAARFVSPGGRDFYLSKSRGHALVIDRISFDREIANEAEAEGAEILLGKKFTGLDEPLVAADGPASYYARKFGLSRKYVIAFQVENKMRTDPEVVELHFGSFAPGFFAWVVPVDEKRVRLGLGFRQEIANRVHESYDPKMALKFFAKLRGYPWDPISEQGGLIPIFDGSRTVFGNVALVGDAAAQVKASTGGGIAIGGQCARMLGEILGKGRNIETYEVVWRESFEKELRMHLAVHNFYSKLSDSEFEELFSEVDDEIISLIERNADMESLAGLQSAAAKYISKHPLKIMKLMKFLRYVDQEILRMFKF